jgi:hypothetical protein
MSTPRQLHFKLVLLSLCLVALAGAGCQTTGLEPSSIHGRSDTIATSEQLRLKMRSLVDPLCGEIVAAADLIANGTTNHAVQREALLWKIEAIPEMRKALFQPDAYTALVDTWVFSCQMRAYFEDGPGKEKLAGSHLQAAAACQQIESKLDHLAASLTKSGDVTRARMFVQQWAAEHPIQNSISARESTVSRATEWDIVSTFSAIKTVDNINATVDDLNRRVEVYSDQLFQQARWEAELFKLDLLAEMPLAQAFPLAERAVKSAEQATATVDRLAPDIERALAVAENTPKIIAAEREETLKELHAAITEERVAMTSDIEQTSYKVVDHAFWRAAELLTVVLVFLVIGLVVAWVVCKRSRVKNG